MLLGDALERGVRRPNSLLPRNRRLEPIPASGDRPGHAFASVQLMKAQSAFVAHPALVDIDISSRDHPEYCSVAMIDPDIAAGRASPADGIRAQQEPDSAFEPEIARRQGAHRTDVYDVPGVWICKRLILDRAYLDVIASPKELHLAGARNIIEKANTSRTQNAAL